MNAKNCLCENAEPVFGFREREKGYRFQAASFRISFNCPKSAIKKWHFLLYLDWFIVPSKITEIPIPYNNLSLPDITAIVIKTARLLQIYHQSGKALSVTMRNGSIVDDLYFLSNYPPKFEPPLQVAIITLSIPCFWLSGRRIGSTNTIYMRRRKTMAHVMAYDPDPNMNWDGGCRLWDTMSFPSTIPEKQSISHRKTKSISPCFPERKEST